MLICGFWGSELVLIFCWCGMVVFIFMYLLMRFLKNLFKDYCFVGGIFLGVFLIIILIIRLCFIILFFFYLLYLMVEGVYISFVEVKMWVCFFFYIFVFINEVFKNVLRWGRGLVFGFLRYGRFSGWRNYFFLW